MSEITKDHVEWAVVDRLRLMLEETPHEQFNVTQTYALFSSILCWVVQRIRIPTHEIVSRNDRIAHQLSKTLSQVPVRDDPWRIHVVSTPRIEPIGSRRILIPAPENFETTHTAFRFLKNLRDATAHGDARNVLPFSEEHFLFGFTFSCAEFNKDREKTWDGKITLIENDMRQLGIELARTYCNAIRPKEPRHRHGHFGKVAASIQETAA
jgi:hypothetical protein